MKEVYRATSEQVHSWQYHNKYNAHQNHQILTVELDLIDPDLSAVDKSIEYLVIRHESLRTYFLELGDGLKQCVIPFNRKMFLPLHYDLSGLTHPELRMQEIREEMKLVVSDLAQPPLIQSALFRITAKRFHFCFMIHHIISDEWSKGIIYKELITLYELFRKGVYPSLPTLEMQLKDYAIWQEKWLYKHGPDARKYWSVKLSSFEDMDDYRLITNYQSIIHRSFGSDSEKIVYSKTAIEEILDGGRSAFCHSYISNEQYVLLKEYAYVRKVSIGAILNASLKLLFYVITGKKEILLAMPAINRHIKGTESIIGGLGGGVYLSQAIQLDMTAADVIRYIYMEFLKSANTLIFDHDEMGLNGDILRLTTDLYVNFMNKSVATGEKMVVSSSEEHILLDDKEYYAISCIIIEHENGIMMQWKYNVMLYSAVFMRELINKYLLLINLISRNPDIQINDLIRFLKEENNEHT